MRFAPIKSDDHWICRRSIVFRTGRSLVVQRWARERAFLRERGMVFAQRPAKLKAAIADILDPG
jgi:hypothetical protein